MLGVLRGDTGRLGGPPASGELCRSGSRGRVRCGRAAQPGPNLAALEPGAARLAWILGCVALLVCALASTGARLNRNSGGRSAAAEQEGGTGNG